MDVASFSIVGVIIFVVAAIGLLVIGLKSTYQVAGPNEALVISGAGGQRKIKGDTTEKSGFKIVTGGGTVVLPGVQLARRLSLNLREAQLSTDCVTVQGIPVGIQGVAMYKVGDDVDSITNAARRFLDQPEATMDRNIQNLLDGHLRSIVGAMTVENLIRDRNNLTDATRAASGNEMEKLGLVMDSLQIQEITDPTKYIENLALPHIAEVKRTARIAQAQADQMATQAEQEADANKAASTRDSSIKQAGYTAEIQKAKAQAAQQGPLADAIAQQQVVVEQTKIAQLEADRKEQQLQVDVRKPADAAAYATKVEAEAARDASISKAQADAQRVQLDATAQANSTQIRGEAQAAAQRAVGLAEADATKAKLVAEAEGIKARADALAANQDAVINQGIVDKLPLIVAEAAKAFGNIKNLTVLEGGSGISSMLKEIVGSGISLVPMISSGMKTLRDQAKDEQTTNGLATVGTIAENINRN